jgi:hypothetical protein
MSALRWVTNLRSHVPDRSDKLAETGRTQRGPEDSFRRPDCAKRPGAYEDGRGSLADLSVAMTTTEYTKPSKTAVIHVS